MVKIIKTDSGYFYEIGDKGKKTRVSEKAYKEYKKSRKMKGGANNATEVASTNGNGNSSYLEHLFNNDSSTAAGASTPVPTNTTTAAAPTTSNSSSSSTAKQEVANVLISPTAAAAAAAATLSPGSGSSSSSSIQQEGAFAALIPPGATNPAMRKNNNLNSSSSTNSSVQENISPERLVGELYEELKNLHNHIKTNEGANNVPNPEYNIVREYYTLANAVYQSLLRFINTYPNIVNSEDYRTQYHTNNNFYYYNSDPIMNTMNDLQKNIVNNVHIHILNILARFNP